MAFHQCLGTIFDRETVLFCQDALIASILVMLVSD